MFDLVIRGGDAIDGTGAPRRATDMGISDGRIALIGQSAARGGGVLAFIEFRAHHDAMSRR